VSGGAFVVLLRVHLFFPESGSLKSKRAELNSVKAHLRQLYRRFNVEELPQIQKRTALVRIALGAGLVRGPG